MKEQKQQPFKVNPLIPGESYFYSKYSNMTMSDFMEYTSVRDRTFHSIKQPKEEKVLSDNDLFENVLNDLKKVNAEIY